MLLNQAPQMSAFNGVFGQMIYHLIDYTFLRACARPHLFAIFAIFHTLLYC